MRDGALLSILFSITILGAISIILTFLISTEPKHKAVTDIKEVIINGELYRKVEKGD